MANPLLAGLAPTHPGELLREDVLPAVGKPKAEVARLLDISRQALYDILDERSPVTPKIALKLGKLFGNGPELWSNMQMAYDLARAKEQLGADLDRIPTLEVA